MHDSAFSREPVFKPELFNMNQRTLPLAKQQMLEGGQHEQVVFGKRHLFFPWFRTTVRVR